MTRALLLLFGCLLPGCALMGTYQPRNIDEWVRMAKESGGTGCTYARSKGNARPYADVEVAIMAVGTWGKGTSFEQCLQTLPAEARSLEPPE